MPMPWLKAALTETLRLPSFREGQGEAAQVGGVRSLPTRSRKPRAHGTTGWLAHEKGSSSEYTLFFTRNRLLQQLAAATIGVVLTPTPQRAGR